MSARILVVDDNADTVALMRALLEAEGYRVATALNGRDALHMLVTSADDAPCLVLLDLDMPQMDGRQLVNVMRSYLRFSHLPVVLITAYQRPSNFPPVEAVLAKPVGAALLLETVKRFCSA